MLLADCAARLVSPLGARQSFFRAFTTLMRELSGTSFDNSATPRWVPILTRLRLAFGGFINQFGWALIGIGSIVVWGLQLPAIVHHLIVFHGPLETARATVTSADASNAKENRRRVYRYTFTFSYGGKKYSRISYGTDQTLNAGDRKTTEFPEGRPQLARLVGYRSTLFSPAALFTGIFPLLGAGFLFFGVRRGRNAIKLLTVGHVGYGRLVAQERTGGRVNRQPVYKLKFEFEGGDGQTYHATATTHETLPLTDEAAEPLLYDPRRPERNALLDDLPGRPRIDASSEIRNPPCGATLACLILPLLVLTGNALYLVFRMQ